MFTCVCHILFIFLCSKNAEQTYDALERYGQDLTALAEEGKLDPVIGRDDEIR